LELKPVASGLDIRPVVSVLDLKSVVSVMDLRPVDKSVLDQANKISKYVNHSTAHLRANEPNDSVQLPVPELTDYFEDIFQEVRIF